MSALSRRSAASLDPALRHQLPASLRDAQPLKPGFEAARDPLYKAIQRALRQTEAQRREEQDSGSLMVKLHRPMPTLRPRNHQAVLRSHFDQDWIKEQRRAALQQLASEEQSRTLESAPQRVDHSPSR